MGINLAIKEWKQNFDFHLVVEGSYVMPCGCKLSHRVKAKNEEYTKTKKGMLDMLNDWFADRIKWHDCNLVAKDNMFGTIREANRGKSKEVQADSVGV